MYFSFGRRHFPVIVSLLLAVPSARILGQSSGAAKSPAASNPATPGNLGTNGSINNNRTTTFPNPNQQTQQPQQSSPIFLSGKVMFDDGNQPDRDIKIERVCGGNVRIESHTDSKGRFSFQLGQNSAYEMDASDNFGSAASGRSGSATNGMGGFGGGNTFGDRGSTNLWNCELRASYPGYRSDLVELGTRRALDSPDVGTIVLHHLGNVQGTTISLTTAMAPKDARKEYEKGLQAAQKGKFEEAMKRLSSATELYPKYAIAWYALGQVQQRQGHSPEARSAYEKAFAADAHYVSPLDQMALLAAQEGKWEEAANYSKQAVSLNPVEFPSSLWYNALANYNLQKPADAEKSTKDLLKLDTRHHYPEAENLMAQLLLNSGKYPEAAGHLRSYLALVPNAKNADALKQMLLKIEAAQTTAPPPIATGKP